MDFRVGWIMSRGTCFVLAVCMFLCAPIWVLCGEQKASPAAVVKKYYKSTGGLYLEKRWGKWQRSEKGLYRPNSIGIHADGTVYIVSNPASATAEDFDYHRAQRFTDKGVYLGWFGGWQNGMQGEGWIAMPSSVGFAVNGYVYLKASLGGTIKTFTAEGAYKSDFPGWGDSGGPAAFLEGVCGDRDNNIYVSVNSYIGVVNKFTSKGKLLYAIDEDAMGGDGKGFKSGPQGLACDRYNNLYVCDCGNDRIVKFDSTGKMLSEFGAATPGTTVMVHADCDFAASGVDKPDEVAISPDGSIYVLGEHKVYRYDGQGVMLSVYGGQGNGADQFINAQSLGCAPDGKVYVLDADVTAEGASVRVLRPAYYKHDYAAVKLVGKVKGVKGDDLLLVSIVIEGEDGEGNEFFAAARPKANGKYIFKKFPKGADYRVSVRGLNTLKFQEVDDITGTAGGNVKGLNFTVKGK